MKNVKIDVYTIAPDLPRDPVDPAQLLEDKLQTLADSGARVTHILPSADLSAFMIVAETPVE